MKCPIDKTDMEKGIINEDDLAWVSSNSLAGKIPSMGRNFAAKIQGGKGLWAYRCPKCGKVELTTEV